MLRTTGLVGAVREAKLRDAGQYANVSQEGEKQDALSTSRRLRVAPARSVSYSGSELMQMAKQNR